MRVSYAKVPRAKDSRLRRSDAPQQVFLLCAMGTDPGRGSRTELFGDDPVTMPIRMWMRAMVRKEITSFLTSLSTLCPELYHHMDFEQLRFRDSWHTRGFYERAAVLRHHRFLQLTPPRTCLGPRRTG